jgi:hypothetical protein
MPVSANVRGGDPLYDAPMAADEKVFWQKTGALLALMACRPTTLRGVIAALEHVGQPNRPVRMIVAYPAGGINDIYARLMGQRLWNGWGSRLWHRGNGQDRRGLGRARASRRPSLRATTPIMSLYILMLSSTISGISHRSPAALDLGQRVSIPAGELLANAGSDSIAADILGSDRLYVRQTTISSTAAIHGVRRAASPQRTPMFWHHNLGPN